MYSGRDGIAALPYFDEFDLSTIDVLLISQYVPLLFPSTSVPAPLHYVTEVLTLQNSGNMSQMRDIKNVADRDAFHPFMFTTDHVPV